MLYLMRIWKNSTHSNKAHRQRRLLSKVTESLNTENKFRHKFLPSSLRL